MREIKFRGLDKNGNWRFGYYHAVHEAIQTYHYIRESSSDKRIDPVTLGQFTGLNDAKGKEIYEGDIIEYKSYSVFKRWWSDTKEIPIIEEECKSQRKDFRIVRNSVEFSDGGFRLGYHLTLKDVSRGQKFERGQSAHGDTEGKQWDFEVIGNIYEHKELLK